VIDAKGIAMTEQASGPALPGEDCRVPPHESWSHLERWVWQEVCCGRIGDINRKLGWCPLPKDPDGWGPERRLSARFLETLLLHDPWRGAIPRQGVSIVGALFDEQVDLNEAEIAHGFWLDRSRFTSNVDFHRIRTSSLLSLEGSVFTGTLTMASASIGGDLFMRKGAEFAEVDLRGAKIGGQLSLIGAKVTGTLDMDSASIGGSLLMSSGAEFAEVILRGAKIGGQLSLIGAKVTGTLTMESTSIGDDLLMRGGQFLNLINLVFSKIGGTLDLRGATLAGLDLTGARVDGEFHLASGGKRPAWSDGARLVLRNTRVGAVQDEPGAWPKRLDLNGFTYERFSGFGADPEAAVGKRGSKSFIEWLARDEPYTPQPYHQCAEVLREMGHPEMANDVLHAGRERERAEASQREEHLRWIGLSLLSWTIGYGYGQRYFRSLWWVAGITVLGSMMLLIGGQSAKIGGGLLAGLFFSLDLLLPIIQLHEPHYRIVLDGLAKYYFAIHKLMGYVLASFLIAGLAGLTK
jgi:uncharacterized protein YjbI with pentapeptide repeats